MINNYTFEEHRHIYAVWTAARAVSRNFTTTAIIQEAINDSGLREFVNSDFEPTQEQFDNLHVQWADKIVENLSKTVGNKSTYGRAAKIISIYLKTSIILCSKGECKKSHVIHPPIDSILLNGIAENTELKELAKECWTLLKKDDYWNLVKKLKDKFGSFDWRLEVYWQLGSRKTINI